MKVVQRSLLFRSSAYDAVIMFPANQESDLPVVTLNIKKEAVREKVTQFRIGRGGAIQLINRLCQCVPIYRLLCEPDERAAREAEDILYQH